MNTYFTLSELQELKVIATGQTDDLLIDDGCIRIWLSRCTTEDGEPYDNKVTVEHLENGHWIEIATYQAV